MAIGFTKVPHGVFELMMRTGLSKREYMVMLYIIRHGYGYNKAQSECVRNVGRMVEYTGLDRSHINTTLRQLVEKGIISIEQDKIRLILESGDGLEAETASGKGQNSLVGVKAKTASEESRPKQPQKKAETATDCGQNSLASSDNALADSDLPSPKERLNKIETPISPEKGDCVPPNSVKATEQIMAFLNLVTGKAFKLSTKATQRLIKARLSEGFTVEDFNKVIRVKSEQWKDDKKMDGYLRPQTLFGPKFEGYLQESAKTTTAQTAHGF